MNRWRTVFKLIGVLCLALTSSVGVVQADDDDVQPKPTPASNRAPTYVRSAPAGALQIQVDPPAVGGVIMSDPLVAPGVLSAGGICANGKNTRDYVDEGVIVKVTGSCGPSSPLAIFETGEIVGLDIPDGEMQVDFKMVSGIDRAGVLVFVRAEFVDGCYRGYSPMITARGSAVVLKLDGCGASPVLGGRNDLADRIRKDDWNTIGVRLEGPNMWVYLNDELTLSLADSTFDHGGLNFRVWRTGEVSDDAESAVVFRNVRVSELLPR